MRFTNKILVFLLALLMLIMCIPGMVCAESADVQDVLVPNTPIKGMIQIEKRGPMLIGFDDHQDAFGYTVHTPLYNEGWLEGAVFEVRAAEDIIGKDGTCWFKANELAATVTTTSNRETNTELLPLGHYYVTEVSAPEGYLFDSARYDVVLAATDQKTPVVKMGVLASNDFMPTRIHLTKEKEIVSSNPGDNGMVNSVLTNTPGEGFIFGLYNKEKIKYATGSLDADSLIATAITDKEGKLTFSGDFPHGSYSIQELACPDGWRLDQTRHTVLISDDARTENNEIVITLDEPIRNEIIRADVRISKTDITGSDYLPNCLIEIKNVDGEIVLRAYTDDDGYLPVFHAVPGTYTYREVLAPEGYALCTSELTFTVNENGEVTGQTTIADDYTRFSVLKTDSFHKPLAGVAFGLFREDGTLQASAVSDDNGLVMFEKIPYGTYTIEETKPLSGYLKNSTKVPITIDGTFVNPTEPIATLENCLAEILIQKVDQHHAALAGAEFGLFDGNGEQVMTAVSDSKGMVRFVGVQYGTYTIREVSAPDGYLLNHDEISLTIDDSYANSKTPMATVVNQQKKIMCIKVDTAGNPLPGVEFSLFNAATMEKTETAISDANGMFVFRHFDYGDWIIRETTAPEGFCPMEDIRLHVGEDWIEPKPIMCVNIPDHFEFMKTDSSGVPIAGVKFRLEDDKGKEIATYESGKDGIVRIQNLKPGVYYIKEIETLEGYSLSGEIICLKVDKFYTIPEEMKRFMNYTVIQTGVNLAVTSIMWVGIGLIVVSGTLGLVRKRWFAKKKIH